MLRPGASGRTFCVVKQDSALQRGYYTFSLRWKLPQNFGSLSFSHFVIVERLFSDASMNQMLSQREFLSAPDTREQIMCVEEPASSSLHPDNDVFLVYTIYVNHKRIGFCVLQCTLFPF